MKKFYTFIFILTTIQSSSAFILDGIINFKNLIEERKLAVLNLEQYVDQIAPTRQKIYRGLEVIYIDDYLCGSIAARKSLNEYKKIENDITRAIYLSNFVDSLAMTAIAVYCKKRFNPSTPTMLLALVVGALGIVAHQNQKLETIPEFDFNLKKQEVALNGLRNSAFKFITIFLLTGYMSSFICYGPKKMNQSCAEFVFNNFYVTNESA